MSEFQLAALLLVTLFSVTNIFARFEYWVEGSMLPASWHILWVVPLLPTSILIDSIRDVVRFRPLRDSFRAFRSFGRPFSRQGTLVIRKGKPSRPIYRSPQSFAEFRHMIAAARGAVGQHRPAV
ncbi:MAG: hypothetical protein CL908_02515 [Deltaproteobacteria bacterium]|nr:hypothetical protein [Deltaproteobacteria bacterium]